jgi:hypothetical protein
MSVSQVLDLSLAEPIEAVIPLAVDTLPVLPFTIEYASSGQEEHTNLANKVDRMTGRIPLFLLFRAVSPEEWLAKDSGLLERD